MEIRAIDTINDVFKLAAEAARRADAAAEPWQTALQPGAHYASYIPELGAIVYGEIVDDPELRLPDTQKYVHAFSRECPEGEYGFAAAATIAGRLTSAQYAKARALGWPSELGGFAQVIADDPRWQARCMVG